MIRLTRKISGRYKADTVVYFVRHIEEDVPACPDVAVRAMIERAVAAGDFAGKDGQILMYYPGDKEGPAGCRRILVAGLGKDDLCRETFRKGAGSVCKAAQKTGAEKLLIVVPTELDFNLIEMVECMTEGFVLANYRFRKYKTGTDPDEDPQRVKEISLYAGNAAGAAKGLKLGRNAALAVCAARDMANEPGNHWTSAHFVEFATELSAACGLKCKVLDNQDMKRLGMGGIVGVNQGSAEPAKMIIMEYRTGRKVPVLLLVGKGLTFDSGGISLKPGSGMEEMKYDMSGGAAVLAAMQAIGDESPKSLDIVAIVPATENLPGPAALKPGDIIRQYGGKTVEVINTDAEGRLILADALAYGIDKYKPAGVIDLATLTGAVIVGLGHHRTGLLANDQELAERVKKAAARSGEPVWQLPLAPEYTKQLKSEIADIKNVGKRDAGTITAAAFLREFVGDTPWVHLDIAGTAWEFTEKPYMPKGPSGVGVRTILDLIRKW